MTSLISFATHCRWHYQTISTCKTGLRTPPCGTLTHLLVELDAPQQLDAVQETRLVELAVDAEMSLEVPPTENGEETAADEVRGEGVAVLRQADRRQPALRHPVVVEAAAPHAHAASTRGRSPSQAATNNCHIYQ